MKRLKLEHDFIEQRLFIESSYFHFEVLFLQNDLSSIRIGHSVHMKEASANMPALLDSIKYGEYNKWKIYSYLKVIAILLGIQL